MEELTGKQLGPYRIIEKLGAGGMATVFKAYQPRMDRFVALKILPRHLSDNPEFVLRFKQEAQVIAKLEHPHILPVFDFGEAEGYTYLAMRLVGGGTLADLMKDKGRLDLPTANRIVRQVGEALDYAHNKGVIHRDFKPGNVLIDDFGNCLLTDFGIAKLLEATTNLTATGGILGTPTYVSPEQGMGQTIDSRSDIYSLGVVLYQMVTGEVPFKADTPMGVIFKHVQEPLPLPREKVPELSEAVEMVILKALAKEPDDRFTTVSDMVAALETALTRPDLQTFKIPAKEESTEKLPSDTLKESPPPKDQTKTYEPTEASQPSRRGGLSVTLVIIALALIGAGGWFGYQKFTTTKPILTITTTPEKALVYVDGGRVGISPAKVKALTPGTHKIKIQKDRYQDYEDGIFIQEDEPQSINAKLTPLPFGDLKVTSNPEGATVFIDGESQGTTPVSLKDVPEGERNVMLKMKGFDPWESKVKIVPLQEANLSADLVTIYGPISVSSKPSEAEVLIDGQSVGKTPLKLDKVLKGNREVEIRKSGYDPWKDTVIVAIDKPSEVSADLATIYGDLKVESQPSGATVLIDGKKVGETPYQIAEIKKGKHNIEIRKDDFDGWKKELAIVPAKLNTVSAKLLESYGSIKVLSEPEDAEIFVAGKKVGEAPVSLERVPKGKIKVDARKDCFESSTQTVIVIGGEERTASFRLPPTCGSISVTSDPIGANWFLDHKSMGTTPSEVSGVSKGNHRILIKIEDYKEWDSEVTVSPNRTINVAAKLELIGIRDGHYIKLPNGILRDKKTSLEWFAGPDESTTWDEAKEWVDSLSIAGGNWRMPTIDELKSLYQQGVGSRNMTKLLNTTGWWVWSSEKSGWSNAWEVSFTDGGKVDHKRTNRSGSRGFAVRTIPR